MGKRVMSITKKQKLILKQSIKALHTLLSNEIPLREMLYSPFNPTIQKYTTSRNDETNIICLLEFIAYGQSRWDRYQLELLVSKYAPSFGYKKK